MGLVADTSGTQLAGSTAECSSAEVQRFVPRFTRWEFLTDTQVTTLPAKAPRNFPSEINALHESPEATCMSNFHALFSGVPLPNLHSSCVSASLHVR